MINAKFLFCLLDKRTNEESIVYADEQSIVISEHELKGREISIENHGSALLVGNELAASSQCYGLDESEHYIVKYVNDLWEKVCKNCIRWNRNNDHQGNMYGVCSACTMIAEPLAPLRAASIQTHENFGCNQFRSIT